ncbi:MAG: hypothetical protein ACK4N5_03955, partial [Myxococcales bacterium]
MDATLAPADKPLFLERQAQQFRPKLRAGLLVGALLFPLYAGWDWLASPHTLRHTLLVRLVVCLGYLALYAVSRSEAAQKRAELLLFSGIVLGSGAVVVLVDGAARAEVLAVGSLMLMVVVIGALAHSVRLAAWSYLLLVATANAMALALGQQPFFFLAVNVFVISASVVGGMLASVSERLARRAFALERQLQRIASEDALSGARTRRSFLDEARSELARAQRLGVPASLLM